jgi:hypothetical protein
MIDGEPAWKTYIIVEMCSVSSLGGSLPVRSELVISLIYVVGRT